MGTPWATTLVTDHALSEIPGILGPQPVGPSISEIRRPRPRPRLTPSWSPRRSRRCGDLVQQALADGLVVGLLHLARRLRRLPEQVAQLGVLGLVLGLEVVGPQHPQVVLDQVGPLLFDEDRPGLERLVVRRVVLLLDGLDRLGLDAGLGRVVDTARKVAVGVDGGRRGDRSAAVSTRSMMRM